MSVTLIEQFKLKPEKYNSAPTSCILNVAEMFGDTLQGEGIFSGHPATFLRLQGCTLDCVWCDTSEVWRSGNPWTPRDLFDLLEENDFIDKLRDQHLVLTGGSPLKQQKDLAKFLLLFESKYGFLPYIEIENECVLKPLPEFMMLVDCWNNSPKLNNSGMKQRARYKPEVIQATAQLANSWFKFVVSTYDDWAEIQNDFLDTGFIKRDQVILMPEGQDQEQLSKNRAYVAGIAAREGVRFSDRLHITIWDKKTGV